MYHRRVRRHRVPSFALVVGTSVAALVACSPPKQDASGAPSAADPVAVAARTSLVASTLATLPEPGEGMIGPSLGRVTRAASTKAGHTLADVDSCETCHADVAADWRKSAHAFASFNNPVYRVVVERFRKDVGEKSSHFCGGCHDVALLVDGAMLGTIAPEDLRAHAGISCRVCHGIESARADGNASWDLDTSEIPVPEEGRPETNLRHRSRVGRAALRTAAMCSTCHKSFLDTTSGNTSHLIGQDDATPWARSAFAGSHVARIDADVAELDCRGCHMPRVPATRGDAGAKKGTVASHAFLGGHTWLAAMQDDPELLARARAFLQGRVSLDVGGLRQGDGTHELVTSAPARVSPASLTVVDVVVKNLSVGHRFPGGVMDAQDTWVEVTVEDVRGARVAEAGTDHERGEPGYDPSVHVLTSAMAGDGGVPLHERETNLFRANVYNHTIPPRDAAVVGYAFTAPADLTRYPLVLTARLRHRSRGLELQRAACADTRSERGKTFGKVGLKKVARAIDACKVQPVTDLARVEVALSPRGDAVPGARVVPARADEPHEVAFERRHAYATGLSHALQEHLDAARVPLVAALELARSPRERAMAEGAFAQVAARQGRVDETFAWASRADGDAARSGLASPPSMARARADVLATQWRLAEAAPFLEASAGQASRDDNAWATLAVTLGSAGDPRAALAAARRGLALQPRDGDMLRVQSLALVSLDADPDVRARAEAAFLERRTPDDAPGVRGRCSAKVPGCANERIPVHVHPMRMR